MKQTMFFANAPRPYEYLIAPLHRIKDLDKPAKLKILDLGVYTWLVKSETHTYPEELVQKLFEYSETLENNYWVNMADYPAINFEHNIRIPYDNVQKTIENWKRFEKSKGKDRVIFTLQISNIHDIDVAKQDIDKFPDTQHKIIGIGSLCRKMHSKKDKAFVHDILRYTRQKFPEAHIHAWGLSIVHYESLFSIKPSSFDNSKWTRPVNKSLPNHSCKQNERVLFFNEYIKSIERKKQILMKQTTLEDFI